MHSAVDKALTTLAGQIAAGKISMTLVNESAEHLPGQEKAQLGALLASHGVAGYAHGTTYSGNGAAAGIAVSGSTPPVDADDLPSAPPRAWSADFEPQGRWGCFSLVYDDILSNSLLPQPPLAVAATLALLSTLVGNKFMIEDLDALRLNLFIIMVGWTGSGKNNPQKRIKSLLASTSKLSILIDRIASYQGLEDKMISDPHRFVCSDEGQKLFAAMADRSNSYLSGILDTLLALYSASNSIYVERATAEEKPSRSALAKAAAAAAVAQPPGAQPTGAQPVSPPPFKQELRSVYNPYLTVLMATTGSAVERAMDSKYVDQGLFNRILFFPTDERHPEMQLVRALPPPPFLSDLVTTCAEAEAPATKIQIAPEVLQTVRNDTVRKSVWAWAAKQSDPDVAENVCARLQENAFRVAGILAVLAWLESKKGPPEDKLLQPVIGVDEFVYAVRLVWWCSTRFGKFVVQSIGETDERNPMVKMRKWLRTQRAKDDPNEGWRNVRRVYRVLSMTSKVATEIINDLINNGEVELRVVTHNNQPVNQIRIRQGREK